ncbi:MAG: preprotein translocase subunit SecE [Deltaproteobacteria bacterium]|nr:preprotein translocase subunit SecE [Deltaproteobacteria bacterium]MBW2447737.1 preprotein translocase subunit SecE [Deltaproteobacteria bacterium]
MASNPADWVRDGRQFLTEVQGEFKKVTWPSQQEYVGGTIGVVVVVTIVTIVLGLADFALGRVVQAILP